jgi:hypothetical protein
MGIFFPFPLYPYKFSHSKGQNSHLQISRLQIFIKPSITNFHINFFPQFHCDWSVRCEQSWFTLLHGTSFWIDPFTYSAPIPILYVNSSICFFGNIVEKQNQHNHTHCNSNSIAFFSSYTFLLFTRPNCLKYRRGMSWSIDIVMENWYSRSLIIDRYQFYFLSII